ncbi:MAG: hypothetical protein AAGJ10_13825 [Bacteroidota bacterium]
MLTDADIRIVLVHLKYHLGMRYKAIAQKLGVDATRISKVVAGDARFTDEQKQLLDMLALLKGFDMLAVVDSADGSLLDELATIIAAASDELKSQLEGSSIASSAMNHQRVRRGAEAWGLELVRDARGPQPRTKTPRWTSASGDGHAASIATPITPDPVSAAQ